MIDADLNNATDIIQWNDNKTSFHIKTLNTVVTHAYTCVLMPETSMVQITTFTDEDTDGKVTLEVSYDVTLADLISLIIISDKI